MNPEACRFSRSLGAQYQRAPSLPPSLALFRSASPCLTHSLARSQWHQCKKKKLHLQPTAALDYTAPLSLPPPSLSPSLFPPLFLLHLSASPSCPPSRSLSVSLSCSVPNAHARAQIHVHARTHTHAHTHTHTHTHTRLTQKANRDANGRQVATDEKII